MVMAMTRLKARTMERRLLATLKAVATFAERGWSPSLAEIADVAGISSKSVVMNHLNKLLDRGLVEREANTARTVRLTSLGRRVLQEEGDTT